ncbi:MAG TPA: hypothetical protein VK446_04460 [Methylocystis sp.]|nr:hypothetical protein [Methylocystis sp.]
MKASIIAYAVALGLCAGMSLSITQAAAQTVTPVATTSSPGSLLIFPLISVDPTVATDTIIEISNDSSENPVTLECSYINELKGRASFNIQLTPKESVSWDVATGANDNAAVPSFPSASPWNPPPPPGNPGGQPFSANRGELVCFAVDSAISNQIAFNHLSGVATVFDLALPGLEPKVALRYKPWSFVARGANNIPAADDTVMGEAGKLVLSGAGAGTYDACPAISHGEFMSNGSTLGAMTTVANFMAVATCNQDLRHFYAFNVTKVQFETWNSNEVAFFPAWQCVDTTAFLGLGGFDKNVANGAAFDFFTLQTPVASFSVAGVQSTECDYLNSPVENAGLLPVATTIVEFGRDQFQAVGADVSAGSSGTSGGSVPAQPGFVLWGLGLVKRG